MIRLVCLLMLIGDSGILCFADDAEPRLVESFYQELDVLRLPQFAVQGLNISQQIHYQVLSSFEIYAADAKGNFKAVQKIESAKLLESDALSQAVFTDSLAKLRGSTFTFQLDRNGEVSSMLGGEDNTKVIPIEKEKLSGTLVTNVIDEDGWKELAQLTLFHPLEQRRPTDPFIRKAVHDWDSLGSWYGKTTFVRTAAKNNISQYRYQHLLEYKKPDGPNNLPFDIVGAQFQLYEAGGIIFYDSKANHVNEVRERFQVKGRVEATMLGLPCTVDLNERQEFTINISGYKKLSP